MDNWKILIISDKESQSYWKAMTSEINERIGPVRIFQENGLSEEIIDYPYDLVILDISKINELHHMITKIHLERSEIRIVVVTSSPTWKLTRDVYRMGAASLIRKSANQEKILQELLKI
jgi:DNA-binding NarL/FixJ family response regulator